MSKLEEARELLYESAIELACCLREYNETHAHARWQAHEQARRAHEQVARDFAAAEMEEGARQETLMCGQYWRQFVAWMKWLRAGGRCSKDPDLKPRSRGCACQWEEGDSPCSVHGGDEEGGSDE